MALDKVRENKLRRMAKRQGLELKKKRRRDHRAIDYQRYWLLDEDNVALFGNKRGATIDEIEAFLTRD